MPHRIALVAVALLVPSFPSFASFASFAQDAMPAELPPTTIIEKMKGDAAKLAPLVRSEFTMQFLAATVKLTEPSARTIYRNREKGIAITEKAYDALPEAERAVFTPRECTPDFYYETGYGTPLVYARVLDLAAPHVAPTLLSRETRPRILDFGYGTIGQLQLLAHCGFDAHGVDVEPIFPALYSEPGDTGPMGTGSASIHVGQWPAEEPLRNAIGGGFVLITSKNTLKRGYVHPSPPEGQTVDPKKLVHLGVSDEEFLARVHGALKPGGVFIFYNICPPQNPPEKEYIPWADGLSPFPRAMLEKAGFEVIAFDAVDQPWVLDGFGALGYTEGKTREEAAKEFFCWYTIVRRKG
jgi:SAM-dependent methyltransferase